MIRSLLFVPGDSARKFERAQQGNADALVLDLEDSVAPEQKEAARAATRAMLERRRDGRTLYVRVNAFDTPWTLADLAAVMPLKPDGIALPKSRSGDDVRRLAHYLDAFEAAAKLTPGATQIIAIATETADSLLSLASYKDAGPRLYGMMWGAEDLAASLGATENRGNDGVYHSPYRMARDLCLTAAAAVGVIPIDTVYTDIEDLAGLEAETIAARRDGFGAKAVIHPKHVDVVNAAFTPGAAELVWARRIIAAFAESPTTGVIRIDGKMIDKPHLRAAEKIVARAGG